MKKTTSALVSAAVTGLLLGTASTTLTSCASNSHMSAMTEKHACKGLNSCQGKGGCKSGDNGCAGKNSCESKGGCATVSNSCKGMNDCKSQGGCKTDKNACKGMNECKNTGGCKVTKMK